MIIQFNMLTRACTVLSRTDRLQPGPAKGTADHPPKGETQKEKV